MVDCSSKKICFLTKEMAEEALVENHAKYSHKVGQGPINIYQCHLCNCYHFTSKGEVHPILKDSKTQNRINKLKQGWDWEDKLR
jgi:hypothetical protein